MVTLEGRERDYFLEVMLVLEGMDEDALEDSPSSSFNWFSVAEKASDELRRSHGAQDKIRHYMEKEKIIEKDGMAYRKGSKYKSALEEVKSQGSVL